MDASARASRNLISNKQRQYSAEPGVCDHESVPGVESDDG
jgi:hypothetical protein